MASRRRYTAQEKAKAVQAVRGSSVGSVSGRLGIPKARLYEWQKSAEQDEEEAEKVLIDRHGSDGDKELTPEMESEAKAVVDLRRYEAEMSLLQDEYDALKNRYIDLVQRARTA